MTFPPWGGNTLVSALLVSQRCLSRPQPWGFGDTRLNQFISGQLCLSTHKYSSQLITPAIASKSTLNRARCQCNLPDESGFWILRDSETREIQQSKEAVTLAEKRHRVGHVGSVSQFQALSPGEQKNTRRIGKYLGHVAVIFARQEKSSQCN